MSKIKNDGLDQYGGPFEQQQFGTAGVEAFRFFVNCAIITFNIKNKCSLVVQVPLNLTGVRAVRPLLLTPASYSQIEQTLLKLNLPSQPPWSQQQPVPAASAEGS